MTLSNPYAPAAPRRMMPEDVAPARIAADLDYSNDMSALMASFTLPPTLPVAPPQPPPNLQQRLGARTRELGHGQITVPFRF
jgi:hypothetical protein